MEGTQGVLVRFASSLFNRVLKFIALSGIDLQLQFRLEPECLHVLCVLQGYLDMTKYLETLFLVLLCRALDFLAQGSLVVLRSYASLLSPIMQKALKAPSQPNKDCLVHKTYHHLRNKLVTQIQIVQ